MPQFDQEKLDELRKNQYKIIRIFRMIESGHRSQAGIANKVGVDRRLVDYYFKVLKINNN